MLSDVIEKKIETMAPNRRSTFLDMNEPTARLVSPNPLPSAVGGHARQPRLRDAPAFPESKMSAAARFLQSTAVPPPSLKSPPQPWHEIDGQLRKAAKSAVHPKSASETMMRNAANPTHSPPSAQHLVQAASNLAAATKTTMAASKTKISMSSVLPADVVAADKYWWSQLIVIIAMLIGLGTGIGSAVFAAKAAKRMGGKFSWGRALQHVIPATIGFTSTADGILELTNADKRAEIYNSSVTSLPPLRSRVINAAPSLSVGGTFLLMTIATSIRDANILHSKKGASKDAKASMASNLREASFSSSGLALAIVYAAMTIVRIMSTWSDKTVRRTKTVMVQAVWQLVVILCMLGAIAALSQDAFRRRSKSAAPVAPAPAFAS